MNCPRCSAAVETVQIEGAQIGRCTKCGGLWFDEFELADLRARKGSETIDTGRGDKAAQHSQAQISCPKCRTPMLRMVDARQPHIWYETCKVCGGTFLDASEFRDLRQHSVVDLIKDVLVEVRGGREAQDTKLSPAVLRRILK